MDETANKQFSYITTLIQKQDTVIEELRREVQDLMRMNSEVLEKLDRRK